MSTPAAVVAALAAPAGLELMPSDGARPTRPRWVKRIAVVAFALWGVLLLVVTSALMIPHTYTLPRPERSDPVLQRGLNALRGPGEERAWLAVHVLYTECGCSKRILDHLFSSTRPSGVSEKLVLVGEHPDYARRAREAGFAVEVIGKRVLEERYHLVSAPLMAVVTPDGNIGHVGGYTDQKQGPEIGDVAIIEEVRQRGEARERPLLGCAVSKELQALLDPIGLKYSRTE